MNVARLAAAGLLMGAAWVYYRTANEQAGAGVVYEGWENIGTGGAGLLSQVSSAAGGLLDYAEGALAVLSLSKMKDVTPGMLANNNVKAFLRVIRVGEGTAGPDGYRTLYGGGKFSGFTDHPRVKVTAGKWTSTAAGAYQALASTWDETKRIMGLPDFSPASQDMFALGRIAARGALNDVLAGRFDSAVRKCAWEWASLPGSPYGQPTISWERAASLYASAGGVVLV